MDDFDKTGLLVVRELFSPAECRGILDHEANPFRPPPDQWWKGRAASDAFYASLGRDRRLVSRLTPRLGGDVVLWGVDVLHREPGQTHPWHCDIESSDPAGGFVSVWIGLRGTSILSSLNCIPGSHRYGHTIQEEAAKRGYRRGQASSEMVLEWAREVDPAAELFRPDVSDGDGIFFDGRLWHGTENQQSTDTRSALLLQYAAGDRLVRMVNLDFLEWPFRFRSSLPPVVLVAGCGHPGLNPIVDPLPVELSRA